MQMRSFAWKLTALLLSLGLGGCASTAEIARVPGTVDYAGSSTVAVFLSEAQSVYGVIDFKVDTSGESSGGERLVREGSVSLAGIAKEPEEATVKAGVNASLIGRDAIAVIVNAQNPVDGLALSTLDDLFTGRVKNWNEVGGPDLAVRAFIVSEASATHGVFRAAVLGLEDYANCETISPDAAMIDAVANNPGAIGQLSFSLLKNSGAVRAIAIDNQRPDVTNFDYPIARPLYLLWRDNSPVVEAFVRWTQGDEGQRVVMKNFVGNRVLGSASPRATEPKQGILVVHTETLSIPDEEDIFLFHPYSPYEIFDRSGEFMRRIPNHSGDSDETATRVSLSPGTYLIRSQIANGKDVELLVTVESGKLTRVDVAEFLGDSHTK